MNNSSDAQKFKNNGASVKVNNRRKPSLIFQAETPKDEARRKIGNTISRDAGKYVSFPDEGIIGLMVGGCTYETWPCFIIVDKDKKIRYVRSDKTFKIEKSQPACLSVLDYLKTYQRGFIENLVNEAVQTDNVELLGDIIIDRVILAQKNKKNNKKGSKK